MKLLLEITGVQIPVLLATVASSCDEISDKLEVITEWHILNKHIQIATQRESS